MIQKIGVGVDRIWRTLPEWERVGEVAVWAFALLGMELSLFAVWSALRFPLAALVLGPLVCPYALALAVFPLFGGWWLGAKG